MPENEDLDELKVPSGDDQLPLELGEENNGAEVEISENGDAELKTVEATQDEESAKNSAQEHEEYSVKVKKRLDKMTAKLREAERREQAALEYARQVQVNLQQAQSRVETLDEGYLHEYKNRVDSQLAIAEANLQDAIERSDGKAVVEAQKLLSSLVFEQQRVNQAASQRRAAPTQQVAPQQPVQQAAPPKPRPDPKAEDWAERNEWFGKDKIMTHAAFGVHDELKEEGFDLSSEEYYDELDRRLRKEFPHKFKRASQVDDSIPAPNVAPANRSSASASVSGVINGRRTIKLTPSEVAIAKKLGVPLEEYAKYVRRTA
jgi:hypothetical protein